MKIDELNFAKNQQLQSICLITTRRFGVGSYNKVRTERFRRDNKQEELMERTRNGNGYQRVFLDIHAVARRYDVKRATIWAWMQQGKFPQPIRLTAGCSRWSLEDLKVWEDEKRAERAPRPQWEERERRKQMREETRQ